MTVCNPIGMKLKINFKKRTLKAFSIWKGSKPAFPDAQYPGLSRVCFIEGKHLDEWGK